MRDPQSEKVVEKLYQTRDEAKVIFRENFELVVENYKIELLHDTEQYRISTLEALYDRLNSHVANKLTQTDRMLYTAAAVEILTAPKDKVQN